MATQPSDPFTYFLDWYHEAGRETLWRRLLTRLYPPAVIHQPDAMVLATTNSGGQPSARVVLFKGIEEEGFAFYTNYQSQKGRELSQNPKVAIVFHWAFPERQVRIQGIAKKLSREANEKYWNTRPRGSQRSGAASPQSEPVANREALLEKLRVIDDRFGSGEIPCPEFWGGFTVVPVRMEFWEARVNRLHERLVYVRSGDFWKTEILAP